MYSNLENVEFWDWKKKSLSHKTTDIELFYIYIWTDIVLEKLIFEMRFKFSIIHFLRFLHKLLEFLCIHVFLIWIKEGALKDVRPIF